MNLVEMFAMALAEFCEEDIDDIWLSTLIRRESPFPGEEAFPFDQFL
jgi:hypothetical protein